LLVDVGGGGGVAGDQLGGQLSGVGGEGVGDERLAGCGVEGFLVDPPVGVVADSVVVAGQPAGGVGQGHHAPVAVQDVFGGQAARGGVVVPQRQPGGGGVGVGEDVGDAQHAAFGRGDGDVFPQGLPEDVEPVLLGGVRGPAPVGGFGGQVPDRVGHPGDSVVGVVIHPGSELVRRGLGADRGVVLAGSAVQRVVGVGNPVARRAGGLGEVPVRVVVQGALPGDRVALAGGLAEQVVDGGPVVAAGIGDPRLQPVPVVAVAGGVAGAAGDVEDPGEGAG